jgi:hypothetical protein
MKQCATHTLWSRVDGSAASNALAQNPSTHTHYRPPLENTITVLLAAQTGRCVARSDPCKRPAVRLFPTHLEHQTSAKRHAAAVARIADNTHKGAKQATALGPTGCRQVCMLHAVQPACCGLEPGTTQLHLTAHQHAAAKASRAPQTGRAHNACAPATHTRAPPRVS